MSKVKIIADSGCNVDLEMAKNYNIDILPFNININDKFYRDLYDIKRDEFFEKIREIDAKVTTATPSIGDFLEILEKNYAKGYRDFVIFSISKKISGMNQMLNIAKEEFEDEKDDVKIKIIDTQSATIAAIYPIIEASKMALENKNIDTIYKKSLENLKYCNVAGVVRNLDALAKGGRLPKTLVKLANIISFSPVLCVENGEVSLIKKVTGKKKSYKELINYLKKKCEQFEKYQIIIGGADSKEEIEILKEGLEEEIKKSCDFKIIDVTPVIGVHLGNGVIFCSVFPYNK